MDAVNIYVESNTSIDAVLTEVDSTYESDHLRMDIHKYIQVAVS